MPSNYDNSPSLQSNLKICTLNCRSLIKTGQPDYRSAFIRYLRSLKLDILSFQETHAHSIQLQESLDMQLQCSASIWTKHCGIVSMNPSITLTPILITIDQRVIICTLTHINNLFPPITLINIYGPAQPSERSSFYHNLLQLPYFRNHDLPADINSSDSNVVILGNFNLKISSFLRSASPSLSCPKFIWSTMLEQSYQLCSSADVPTFRRGDNSSTIDYIYASPDLHRHFHSTTTDYLNTNWTDHAVLVVNFKLLTIFKVTDSGEPILHLLKINIL